MDEELLLSNNSTEQNNYDPFSNPPNLELARTHALSTSVGQLPAMTMLQFCPCCDNIVNKIPLPVCFRDEQLLSLGVGYPLYFKVMKYFMLFLVGIFFISGSAMYFLMSLKCEVESACITFLGFPIVNISVTEQNNLNKTQIVNMITSIGIFIIVIYLKAIINDDIRLLTAKHICPSLYTIMLQNVPIDIKDDQLIEWIQQRFGDKPCVINWAYNVDELRSAYKLKQKCVIDMNRIKIRLRKYDERQQANPNSILNTIKKDQKGQKQLNNLLVKLEKEIQQYRKTLESYNKLDRQCQKVGTIFVTFERVSIVNRIIDEYQCSFFNSIMKNMFSFIKKSRLQLMGQIIVVQKAPAPKEVIWDNLRFSYIRSLLFQILFICCMLVMLMGGLRLILIFMNYALTYKILRQKTGHIIVIIEGIGMSLIIIVINCLMRLVIQVFTYAKKYYSYTKYEASFSLYYSIFYIINACCLVYVVHGQSQNDTKELLVTDIHIIMLANAYSQPLFKLVDPVMWYRIISKWYITRLHPQDNPYTQQYVNKLWEGHQISNADNYQYITRVLFVTTWFASVAPVGVLLSLLAFVMDYWILKWLLVRVYRCPETVSEDIAKPTLMGLELLPLVYIFGVLQFTYKVSTSQNLFVFFYDFFHYGITTLVLLLCILGYVLFCKRPVQSQLTKTYSQAKIGFGYNYETTNPITKLKGDINYLYDVLKQKEGSESSRLITDLLEISRSSLAKFGQRRQQLCRIKQSMLKKVSFQEQNIEMEVKLQQNVKT